MAWKRNKDTDADASNPEAFDAASAVDELNEAMGVDPDTATDAEFILNLEFEIKELKNQLVQQKTLVARMEVAQQDEIERIKKRLANDSKQQIEKRVDKVLNGVLDVGDDLGRAILSAQDMDHNPAVLDGIRLVRQSFGKRLEKLGVTRMEVLGTPFDPALHDAVSLQPVTKAEQDGIVLAVAAEGYAKNGAVLREAKVVVGKLVS